MQTRSFSLSLAALLATVSLPSLYGQGQGQGQVGGWKVVEDGMPPVMVHPTRGDVEKAHGSGGGPTSTGNNLYYHGGVGNIGVETAPKLYLVLWGSQWASDPSGEITILNNFYNAVGGSSWLNSVTQYCQGVATKTVVCGGSGARAGNQPGILAGTFYDTSAAAPTHPTQSQLAAEAVKAAQYFKNTSSSSNASAQYVIATSHGNSASGFGTQYCAWHSSTASAYGNVAYTNLPYITDAGAGCGANFNGLGATAGITIVGGHEMAETITDQFPNGGWLDSKGEENGDKCAWIASGQGASAMVTLGTNGPSFPVQSLWSNAFNNGAGGCVLSY